MRLGSFLIVFVVSCASAASPLVEPIKPLPFQGGIDAARAAIGQRLFDDKRLSANDTVACSSCHKLDQGGVDGFAHSTGFSGKPTSVNTPTIFNAVYNFRQFWNGRADSLESQIDFVIANPVEMGSRWTDIVAKLSQDSNYRRSFAGPYADGITAANIRNALAIFERTLTTPNARFDRYLRGDSGAISAAEKAGYSKFKQFGCIACHQGVNVGGNMFQKFGVMGDYFANRGKPTEADLGRFLVTGEDSDRYVFKVPSLRNVTRTAPYFHDGTAATLDAAVDVMFRYQLGRVASKEDKAAIIQFLGTLTDETRPMTP